MTEMLLLPAPKPTPLELKQNKKKEELIVQLKKTPIIQIACEKVGVGRATFYRWRRDDKEFAETVDEALLDGAHLVSDLAESKLISAIKQENLAAIIFWLKNHHAKYRTKVDVNANIRNLDEPLTPEQEALVRAALRLAGIGQVESNINNRKELSDEQLHNPAGPGGSDDQRPEGQNSNN